MWTVVLKGFCHLLTLISNLFHLWDIKEDILKNVGYPTVLVTIDIDKIKKKKKLHTDIF